MSLDKYAKAQLFAVFAVICFFGQISVCFAQETAADVYRRGQADLNNKAYDSAFVNFTKAIELDPKFAYAYYGRAQIYQFIKNDTVKARLDYQQTVAFDQTLADAYINLGVIDKSLGYPDEAIDAFTKVIPMLEGKSPARSMSVFYTFRGGCYSDTGKYNEAIADFQKAIQLDANNDMAYDGLGTVYKRKKDYDTALTNYNKAIALMPTSASTYSNRGLAYFYKGNYANALADYNKAIEIDPKLSAAYNNRAAVYDAQNKPELEIADYKKAVELDPNNADAKNNLEIATSVLGDGKGISPSADVRFINAAIRAANTAYANGSKMPTGELACRNLFNSYLALNSASDRLSSLQNGIQFGSVKAPKIEGGNSLEGFAADLARIKGLVFGTATDMRCDFIRVVR